MKDVGKKCITLRILVTSHIIMKALTLYATGCVARERGCGNSLVGLEQYNNGKVKYLKKLLQPFLNRRIGPNFFFF